MSKSFNQIQENYLDPDRNADLYLWGYDPTKYNEQGDLIRDQLFLELCEDLNDALKHCIKDVYERNAGKIADTEDLTWDEVQQVVLNRWNQTAACNYAENAMMLKQKEEADLVNVTEVIDDFSPFPI